MNSPAINRPSKYDLRREEVIDAAAAVFAEFGYHGASTKMIAERVGIRQGSLYYYFSSKEAALEEVCSKGIGNVIGGLTEVVEGNLPTAEKLGAAIANHLAMIVEIPNYVLTFISQRQFLPDDSRSKVGREVRHYEHLIIRLFKTGVADGTFYAGLDCELAALRLITECNGVYAWYGKRSGERSTDRIAADITRDFLAGVAARPAGAA